MFKISDNPIHRKIAFTIILIVVLFGLTSAISRGNVLAVMGGIAVLVFAYYLLIQKNGKQTIKPLDELDKNPVIAFSDLHHLHPGKRNRSHKAARL